jgi:threonine/homoserine/homoserine lactone efflux protein
MPGPAVMLVTTSSMRHGAAASMLAAIGICAANLLWVALSTSGASALAQSFPTGFLTVKVLGVGYILVLAWRTLHSGPMELARREPPPRTRLFGRGVGLQLANPNALVFFGGLLPAYLDPDGSFLAQCAVIMSTVTATELFGLAIYALAADWLARRFASRSFATAFYRCVALAMAASAGFAVYSTWASPVARPVSVSRARTPTR